MLDTGIRKIIDPALNAAGRWLVVRGVTANAVSWAGFGIGVVAAIAISLSWFWTGLILLLLSRICDGLDGAVARAGLKSDLGGFLDIVLDFAFYGMIPLAFVLADPATNAAAGSVLLLTFYVNGASFLTYALMAEKQGIAEIDRGSQVPALHDGADRSDGNHHRLWPDVPVPGLVQRHRLCVCCDGRVHDRESIPAGV